MYTHSEWNDQGIHTQAFTVDESLEFVDRFPALIQLFLQVVPARQAFCVLHLECGALIRGLFLL